MRTTQKKQPRESLGQKRHWGKKVIECMREEGMGGWWRWEEQYACGRRKKPNQLITDPCTYSEGDGANTTWKHAAAQRGKDGEKITDTEKISWIFVCLYGSISLLRRFHHTVTAAYFGVRCHTGSPRVSWAHPVRGVCRVSNEQRTLRIANKLTLEYYNREDERRSTTLSSKNTHTHKHKCSQA